MEPGLSHSSSDEAPLTDRYAIEGEIGRGGMATVFRARDLRHGSTVAVKMLRPEVASMVGADRFTREIRVTARLQHTNILPILDSGESGGVPFYVMPFVEGETLKDRLVRESQLTVDEAVRITREVASALEHAHAQGIVHRDIKPANILLSHGHAMLADFGIARAIDASTAERLTESGIALGTAHYMSPEQASSSPMDGRSDLYSLGCVLYEMLVGVPPFTGASVQAVTIRHAVDRVPGIRTVRPSVSAALEAVILKVLEKVPADRYASAAEFRSALEFSLTAPVTAVRPVPKRSRTLVASLGVVVIAATALVTWQLTRNGSPGVEQNRVLVFPLAGADGQGETTSGEDMATLIGSALDGVGSLRWIDAWPLLPARLRHPDSLRMLDDAATRRTIALRARAGFYVSGNVIRRGDSSDVVLELYDVRGDTAFPRETAKGLRADIWRLAPRAINKLLPKLIPGTRTDVSDWENRPPGAVASFLRAEAAFRRAALTDAMTSYREAVRLDSGFALAAIRGAQAATWSHDPAAAASMVAIARARPLPPRYALFASGYAHYLEGRADPAVAALDSAVRLDSDMAAAWLQLGEVYMHLLPRVGNTDSLAELAFAQAHRVDSTAANILFHLIEIKLRRGDTLGARPLVQRFAESASDSVLTQQIDFMADCARRGTHIDWRSAALARPLAVLSAAASLGSGATIGCAAHAFDTMIRDTSRSDAAYGYRWAALLGLTGVRLAQGRAADAVAAIDSFVTRWNSGTSLFLLGAQVDSLFLSRAKAIARSDEQLFGANYAKASGVTRLWELGLFEARFGRRDVAEAIAADLASRAARSARARDSLLAKSLVAHVAVASGDTSRAITLLSSIVPPSSPSGELRWDEATPAALERVTLARLLVARDESDRALAMASVIDSSWPIIHTWFLAPSLAIRHQAAKKLGLRRLESDLAARLEVLRGAGDGSRSSTTH